MSEAVSYEQFCKHYELDVALEKSKIEYSKYIDNLSIINRSFTDEITKNSIDKAKKIK